MMLWILLVNCLKYVVDLSKDGVILVLFLLELNKCFVRWVG